MKVGLTMVKEEAVVMRLGKGQVSLKSLQTNACGHCLQKESCGTALYGQLLPDRELVLATRMRLKVGDKVLVGIEERHLVRASLVMYFLPLLIMLLTVSVFKGNEESTALLAVFSLVNGFFLVHFLQKRFAKKLIQTPEIIKKIELV